MERICSPDSAELPQLPTQNLHFQHRRVMDGVCQGGHTTLMKSHPERAERPKVFVLSVDNAISVFAGEAEAKGATVEGEVTFDSVAELKRVTAEWPSTRLVAAWNSIPGVVPVRKFTDRPSGLKRIWQAIQSLEPTSLRSPDSPAAERNTLKARAGTKKAALLALLARTGGASVREIMAALGWQSHSVRGCLSNLARGGAGIHSFRRPDGERAYSTLPSPDSGVEEAQ